jgi:TctA family transporter
MKYLWSHPRILAAIVAAITLTAIYPYIEADRRFSMRETAITGVLSIYLCPFIVALIARQRFVFWAVITNALLFVWLVLQVYSFGAGWISLRKDLPGLAVFCVFGLLNAALVGFFVERRIHSRHAV